MLKIIGKKFKEFKKKITLKHIYNFGVILLVLGILIFSSDYLYMKILKIFDDMNYKIFLNTDNNGSGESGVDTDNIDSSQINTNENSN